MGSSRAGSNWELPPTKVLTVGCWLDQSESEKIAKRPLAQLLVLHLLSTEELQAAREAPELHQGDLLARMRQSRAQGLRLLSQEDFCRRAGVRGGAPAGLQL